MAEPFHHDPCVYILREQQRRCAVTEVMEPNRVGEARLLEDAQLLFRMEIRDCRWRRGV
jgi:hypothetical protein